MVDMMRSWDAHWIDPQEISQIGRSWGYIWPFHVENGRMPFEGSLVPHRREYCTYHQANDIFLLKYKSKPVK